MYHGNSINRFSDTTRAALHFFLSSAIIIASLCSRGVRTAYFPLANSRGLCLAPAVMLHRDSGALTCRHRKQLRNTMPGPVGLSQHISCTLPRHACSAQTQREGMAYAHCLGMYSTVCISDCACKTEKKEPRQPNGTASN